MIGRGGNEMSKPEEHRRDGEGRMTVVVLRVLSAILEKEFKSDWKVKKIRQKEVGSSKRWEGKNYSHMHKEPSIYYTRNGMKFPKCFVCPLD